MSPVAVPVSPEAQEARRKASETLSRTSALKLSADHAWFMEHAIGVAKEAANLRAVSIRSTDRERDNAAHVHEAMLQLLAWVDEEQATAKTVVHGPEKH